MAGTPPLNVTAATPAAAHADTFHLLPEEVEQMHQSHPALRYMYNGTLAAIQGQTGASKVKGAPTPPKKIMVGSSSRLAFEINYSAMATVAAIDPANAISTSVDQAKPTNPLKTLNGWWGLLYGYSTWGIEENALFGGDDAHIQYEKMARKDICQQLTAGLSTGIFSDGTTNKFDGFEYWLAAAGTKWNAALGTYTLLAAQALTANASTFTYDTFLQWVDQCRRGTISGTDSNGLRPNVFITTSPMIRLFKKWIQDKVVFNVNPSPANIAFLEYGQPEDYVFVDGVLCFADDVGLSGILSTNYAVGYLLNFDYWHLIFHKSKKYGFSGLDAYKAGGEAPEKLPVIDLPWYVEKSLFKKVILGNMFCERPRNQGRAIIANA